MKPHVNRFPHGFRALTAGLPSNPYIHLPQVPSLPAIQNKADNPVISAATSISQCCGNPVGAATSISQCCGNPVGAATIHQSVLMDCHHVAELMDCHMSQS